MPLQTAVLQGGATLSTSAAALYTVPTGKSAWVKRAVFANTGSGAAVLTVTVTRAGGVAVTIIPGRSIAAGATDLAPELVSLALASGDAVSASATVASVVTAFLSGLTA